MQPDRKGQATFIKHELQIILPRLVGPLVGVLAPWTTPIHPS
jgi:hypothetical protein